MRRLTTIPSLILALVLGGLSLPAGAQGPKPPDVQPAQRPAREIQKDLPKVGPPLQSVTPAAKSPAQSGPGTSELPTNRGINMGKPFAPGFDPASKIPGAGGADKNEPIRQTTPALPTSTDPLADRTTNTGPDTLLGDKGTKVGPEYFSKEQKLKDLTDPKSAMKDMESIMKEAGLGGTEGKNPLDKSGQDLLGGLPITVTPGAGKNVSGKQEQQSEEGGSPAPIPYPVNPVQPLGTTKPAQDKIPLTLGDEAGTRTGVASPKISGSAKTVIGNTPVRAEGRSVTNVAPKTEPGTRLKPSKTSPLDLLPNPETDTGDGHVPKGIIPDRQPKSPAEIEAERKRQVTLPGEGQSQRERVYMSPEDALKGGISKSTDGRIDPADHTSALPTGRGVSPVNPRPDLPIDPEQDFGRPGFAGGGGVPPLGGGDPPGPAASQGPTSSQAPSTSTDKNSGGTTGDTSNKP